MAATQPITTFLVAIGALCSSFKDEANGCTSFWFWEQVLAEFSWCHSLVIREWRVGRASTDTITPTLCPARPLEAQTGLKSPGHSQEGRSQVLFHSDCPSCCINIVCKDILPVNPPSPGSPPYITTQNLLQGCHQVQQHTMAKHHKHIILTA
ncbi:hypothetical protein BFJ68_g798 [Fusarium oxysporum]|uniref:Uncharacterized protein n=1 Tax=Fusarium oxysporum TaxID=5507 RepID=A0A420S651_FUSOX|nr:hypothetical protein BFJ68_g798 [Fusarium oxysporum]